MALFGAVCIPTLSRGRPGVSVVLGCSPPGSQDRMGLWFYRRWPLLHPF